MKIKTALYISAAFVIGYALRSAVPLQGVKAQTSSFIYVQPAHPGTIPFPRTETTGTRIVGFSCVTKSDGSPDCFVASQ